MTNLYKKRWEVVEMEYERGWGSKVFNITRFDTLEEANVKVTEVNSQNTCNPVPDWYIIAKEPREVFEEIVKKATQFKKGYTPWNKGKPMSEEQKQKLRGPRKSSPGSNKGKKFSEEIKEKMRLAKVGYTPWAGINAAAKANTGKKLSKEHIEKRVSSWKRNKESRTNG